MDKNDHVERRVPLCFNREQAIRRNGNSCKITMETLSRGQNVQDRWGGIKARSRIETIIEKASILCIGNGECFEKADWRRGLEIGAKKIRFTLEVWEIIDEIIEILAIEKGWKGNGKLNSRRKRCSSLAIFPVAPNGTDDARIKYAF